MSQANGQRFCVQLMDDLIEEVMPSHQRYRDLGFRIGRKAFGEVVEILMRNIDPNAVLAERAKRRSSAAPATPVPAPAGLDELVEAYLAVP